MRQFRRIVSVIIHMKITGRLVIFFLCTKLKILECAVFFFLHCTELFIYFFPFGSWSIRRRQLMNGKTYNSPASVHHGTAVTVITVTLLISDRGCGRAELPIRNAAASVYRRNGHLAFAGINASSESHIISRPKEEYQEIAHGADSRASRSNLDFRTTLFRWFYDRRRMSE